MKKIILLAICIFAILPMAVNAAFTDVPEDHWAYTYINELSEKGVINGMGNGIYAPNDTLTKGQYMKLIMTASLPNFDFSKVQKDFDHWADGYVKIAENYEVIEKGEINESNINEPISRIDVIRILSSCDIVIRKFPQIVSEDLNDIFYDTNELNEMNKFMLMHAVGKGIINGYNDKSFRPNNNLTRAEVSKILSIYMGM